MNIDNAVLAEAIANMSDDLINDLPDHPREEEVTTRALIPHPIYGPGAQNALIVHPSRTTRDPRTRN